MATATIVCFHCTNVCVVHTLDGPLEKGLAGLAGGHAVVVAGGHVAAHQTQPLGHGAQHELTLHRALFLAEPGGGRGERQKRR